MKRLVVGIDEMDRETFLHHMNLRHKDSLGGLKYLCKTDTTTEKIWRAFHQRLHQIRIDLKHEH